MFRQYNDNKIIITRGDDAHLTFFINTGTKLKPVRFDLRDNFNSKLTWYLMKPNTRYENAILTKEYTSDDCNDDGDVIVKFDHKDTIDLQEGIYYYTVKLTYYDGETKQINTIIPESLFLIED
jgi:hypothetical protein